jgi:hypothetical protein
MVVPERLGTSGAAPGTVAVVGRCLSTGRVRAGTARSKASWTEWANEGEGAAARPPLAASTVAHRSLEARALIGSWADILAHCSPDARRGWSPSGENPSFARVSGRSSR